MDRRWAVVLAVASFAAAPRVARAADFGVGETVAGIKQVVDPLSRLDLRLDAGVATSWPPRGSRAALSVEIATRPDFWYAVGVAAVPEMAVGDVITVDDSGVATSRQTRTEGSGVAVSARIFKRFGALVVSGGLIENRGGLAAELRGLDDCLRLEAQLSQHSPWAPRAPVDLRVGGSAQWRWLYVQAGGQNLLDPATRAAYLGVGIRWHDPDLGSVLPWVRR